MKRKPKKHKLTDTESAELSSLKKESQVTYTVGTKNATERVPGVDFMGNMTEFQLIFEWRWTGDEEKFLYEKSTDELVTHWIHIKDSRLDANTYPGQEQKIKFEEGRVKFVESLLEDQGEDS